MDYTREQFVITQRTLQEAKLQIYFLLTLY
ncbi:Uncharacterised protein [Helicobacter cinaedi]|uniref:Uncharacterized protein n=1 Tax=Helicobacter cinaedi TaxID=213 RepID=A0A377JV15_9HELI|nr:Uncharacterised protein [Helicobacter cinaedi]